jgi:hypothetical protein
MLFRAIDADVNQFLLVVDDGTRIVGNLQLTFIPGLATGGLERGQIEAVRVASDRLGAAVTHHLSAPRVTADWSTMRFRAWAHNPQ